MKKTHEQRAQELIEQGVEAVAAELRRHDEEFKKLVEAMTIPIKRPLDVIYGPGEEPPINTWLAPKKFKD